MSVSNWKEDMDAAETAYLDMFPELQGSLSNSPAPSVNFNSSLNIGPRTLNRFPPLPNPILPDEMYIEDYIDLNIKKNKNNDEEEESDLDDYEDTFITLASTVIDNRSSGLSHAPIIFNVDRFSFTDKNFDTITLIFDELKQLREEALQLSVSLKEYNIDSKCEEYALLVANNEPLNKLSKDKLNEFNRCNKLIERWGKIRKETSRNVVMFEELIDVCSDLLKISEQSIQRSTNIDNIYPDWTEIRKLESTFTSSKRCKNFISHMQSYNLPICNEVYRYLQSPSGNAFTLAISSYEFKYGELEAILNYFTTSLNVDLCTTLLYLYINDCDINDTRCMAIALALPSFSNLKILSLRNNNISSIGLTPISKTLWLYSCPYIEAIHIDDNLIDESGITYLARSITHCMFLEELSLSGNSICDTGLFYLLRRLMNRFRKARSLLPRPTKKNLLAEKNKKKLFNSDNLKNNIIDNTTDNDSDSDTSILLDTDEEQEAEELIDENSHNDDYEDGESLANSEFSLSGDSFYTQSSFGEVKSRNDSIISSVSNFSDNNQNIENENETTNNNNNYKEVSGKWKMENGELVKVLPKIKSTTKSLFIIKMNKVWKKIMAIAAFNRLSFRGHNLLSLNVSNCGLTSFSAKMISHCCIDNINIIIIDLSRNNISDIGCESLSKLLYSGCLTTLKLNDCGIGDLGIELITRAAVKKQILPKLKAPMTAASLLSAQLIMSIHTPIETLELSGNNVGPTGANWIAAISKDFYPDNLMLAHGYKSKCAFQKKEIDNDYISDEEVSDDNDDGALYDKFVDNDNDFEGDGDIDSDDDDEDDENYEKL